MQELIFKEDTHEYFLGEQKLISVTQLIQKHIDGEKNELDKTGIKVTRM